MKKLIVSLVLFVVVCASVFAAVTIKGPNDTLTVYSDVIIGKTGTWKIYPLIDQMVGPKGTWKVYPLIDQAVGKVGTVHYYFLIGSASTPRGNMNISNNIGIISTREGMWTYNGSLSEETLRYVICAITDCTPEKKY